MKLAGDVCAQILEVEMSEEQTGRAGTRKSLQILRTSRAHLFILYGRRLRQQGNYNSLMVTTKANLASLP